MIWKRKREEEREGKKIEKYDYGERERKLLPGTLSWNKWKLRC